MEINWLRWRSNRRTLLPFKELIAKTLLMKRSEIKEDLKQSIGSLLSNGENGEVKTSADFGNFYCSVEKHEKFAIVRRSFETDGESLHIPFSCYEPGVQMIFSLDGHSFFNRHTSPFILKPSSHCINFFAGYNCVNLLDDRSKQHDIAFRLNKSFYADLVAQYLSSNDDGLPSLIAQEIEFNTMNQHLPADAAVLGILKNILECPFEGEMKIAYLKEHIRALFTLQLFHFNGLIPYGATNNDNRLSSRDRELLEAVKEYIDQNFLNPSSIESLSKQFGVNEFKLKQGFKTLFETSPIRYLLHKRLAYALLLLKSTDKTIKEIAHEIGYAHAANFTTAFVRAFGNSPQHFRGQ